jgi:hypothetical protein
MFSQLVSWLEVKSKLAGLTLTQEASEKEREGGARNNAEVDFTEALRR